MFEGSTSYDIFAAEPQLMAFYLPIITASCLVVYVVKAWLLGRVFKKAGVGRWKAWVPFVNEFCYFKIGGRSGFNIFLGIISSILALIGYSFVLAFSHNTEFNSMPVAGIVFVTLAAVCLVVYLFRYISATWNIQKKFGKSGAFFILFFINAIAPLWLWILALGGDKYNDKVGRPQVK